MGAGLLIGLIGMSSGYASERVAVLLGDCRARLAELPAGIARTCVTSPPYYGLRDYGADGQIGLEQSPEEYVNALVDVFRAVRRTLTDDGTLWLNLGDSYASTSRQSHGIKAKDLIGIPWMVAFALRADGWYLRSEIIWHKPNPMPESVKNRPTKAHEQLFLLAKSERYYYDGDAIREPMLHPDLARKTHTKENPNAGRKGDYQKESGRNDGGPHISGLGFKSDPDRGKNKRDVWTITPKPFKGAHFATMPPDLAEPCVLAGSAPGDIVIDPFTGSGTTGLVALRHGRLFIGTELNPTYGEIAVGRLREAEDFEEE